MDKDKRRIAGMERKGEGKYLGNVGGDRGIKKIQYRSLME